MDWSMPCFPVHCQLPELAQNRVHRVDDTIQPSHPLASPSPPAFNVSQHKGFPVNQFFLSDGQSISFNFSINPPNEYSELISFRMDWFDLLAVQGTLKSLLQHHSSKASALQCSAFFTIQLSHLYMTTGKTIALTWWTFDGKVISLLFDTPSRFVIAFLPRTKCLLISRLQSLSAVILEPKKIKAMTVSIITSWQIDGKQWKQWQSAEELMCFFKYKFIYFNWRLITLQYFSGFTIHGHESTTDVYVCVPHPEPPSHLPPHPIPPGHPVHQPQALCLMIRIWTGSLFHIW